MEHYNSLREEARTQFHLIFARLESAVKQKATPLSIREIYAELQTASAILKELEPMKAKDAYSIKKPSAKNSSGFINLLNQG